jgi:hypothetical protein
MLRRVIRLSFHWIDVIVLTNPSTFWHKFQKISSIYSNKCQMSYNMLGKGEKTVTVKVGLYSANSFYQKKFYKAWV